MDRRSRHGIEEGRKEGIQTYMNVSGFVGTDAQDRGLWRRRLPRSQIGRQGSSVIYPLPPKRARAAGRVAKGQGEFVTRNGKSGASSSQSSGENQRGSRPVESGTQLDVKKVIAFDDPSIERDTHCIIIHAAERARW